MPKFIIEREMPDAGRLSDQQRQAMAQQSSDVLRAMPDVHWIESYITDNKVYCVYVAPDAEAIREHARRGGFPVTAIAAVRHVCDPATAEPSGVAA